MIIDRRPRFLQAFFQVMRPAVSPAQFRHLWTIVLAVACSTRRAKLVHLAATILHGRHRTTLGAFLRRAGWDEAELLAAQVSWLLGRMRPQKGETIELLLDDTRIAKRAVVMPALATIWDHTNQRFVRGHIAVLAAIRFRGVVFPWRVELQRPKADAGRRYRKATEIAAELIRAFSPPPGVKVRVLFDAFYLCPLLARTCEERAFLWFSVAQKSRGFTRLGSHQKRKIGESAPGWIRHLGRTIHLPRARGFLSRRVAMVDGHLSKVGRVRLVVSKRPGQPWKELVAFVTNDIRLGARSIVQVYERRWGIEVLFKELRSGLGLCVYQMMDERAIVRHLHLIALAHLVLTHHAIEGVGAQARKANQQVQLPPFGQRLDNLRNAVRQEQIRRLFHAPKHRALRSKLEAYLMAA
ncbi:MAG: transposase [Planctomycetota bacterium]|jgi:hypothetical protein